MVEDVITDGKRIAQLLASELTGLSSGPLASVEVTDADPDVEPTETGASAFTIEADGDRFGTVTVTPDAARVELRTTIDEPATFEREGLAIDVTDDETYLEIGTGAAVKSAVDAIRRALR